MAYATIGEFFDDLPLNRKQREFANEIECLLGRSCEPVNTVAFTWSIEDVQANYVATDQQARDVLEECKRKHDATIGMNWEVIDIFADEMGLQHKA